MSYHTSDLVAEMAEQLELEYEQAADLLQHLIEGEDAAETLEG